MTAKVENHCMNLKTRSVVVDGSERVCLNCIWYEQYYHDSRGNIRLRVPTSTGFCRKHEQRRGCMRQPCRDFEKIRD